MAGIREAALRLQLIDNVSAPAKAISGVMRRLDTAVNGLAAGRNAVSQRLDNLRGRMIDAAASAWALQHALSAPIRAAMDFESAMADVTKVVDFPTPAGLATFKKELLDLSARLPVAVTGLAQIAAAAGQAGIAGNELVKFTEGAAKIGVAFDIAAGTAGDALAKLRTGLGYSTDEVFRLADAMNELSNRQASSASDVLDFTTRVGAQAKMYGFAAEQAAAFGSAMISAGAAPEVAATSFNNMGRALTKGAAATKAQRQAYKALGLTSTDVAKRMQKDAIGTTLDVMRRIAKLPAEQRASIVSQLFGDEARALGPLLTNLDLLRQSLGIVADETTYAGSATREYENRSKTTANAMQLFRNRVERLSISIGNALLPALTSVVDTLAPIVDRLSDLATAYPRVTSAVVATTAGLVAFRIAAVAAAFAAGTLRAGALTAAIVSLKGLRVATAAMALALAPFRAALAATGRALTLFAISARIGGIGAALSAVGASALALLSPLKLAAVAVRGLGIALRVAFIGSGVGAVIAAIGAAGIAIYNNWSGITEMFRSFGSAFMAALGPAKPVVEGFASAVSTIASKIAAMLGPLDESGAKWRAWGAALGEIAGGGVATLISGIEKIVGAIRAVIDVARAGAEALSSLFNSGSGATPGTTQMVGGKGGAVPRIPAQAGRSAAPVVPTIDGARADGGPVRAGRNYLVGEIGPEIFRPRRDGTIIPNRELGTQAGAANAGRAHDDSSGGEAPKPRRVVPAEQRPVGRDDEETVHSREFARGAAEHHYRSGAVTVNAPISLKVVVQGGSNAAADLQRAARQAAESAVRELASTIDRQLNRSGQVAFTDTRYGDS